MKNITLILVLATVFSVYAQTNPEIAKSAIRVEMLFPRRENPKL